MSFVIAAVSGLIAGILSAFLGVGGGVVMVPLLLYLVVPDMKMAVGTSLAYIAPIALAGALQHGWRGNVSWPVVLAAVPLGLVGTWVGSELSDVVSAQNLRSIFGVLMVLVGLKMVLSAAPSPEEPQKAEAVGKARVQAEQGVAPGGGQQKGGE